MTERFPVEHRLAALFTSVENALDSSTYTYSDSEYLVRKALVEFLNGENALVASARKVIDTEEVVTAALNYIISTNFSAEDPAEWFRTAARHVLEFSDLAYRNEITESSARYAALLPEGHPRALRVVPLTSSAHQTAMAEWLAADPRLDDEGSRLVYSIYSRLDNHDGIEATFENLKLEAMVASGFAPEDVLPMVAAFRSNRERLAWMSRILEPLRRRDRKGQFADEFGRFKGFFSRPDGSAFSETGRTVGPGSKPGTYQVEFPGSADIPKGIYEMDSAKGESVKAYLPERLVKGLDARKQFLTEEDKRDAVPLDDFLKTRKDAPDNWEKSGKGFKTKDGKFTATPTKTAQAQKVLEKAQERGDEPIISGTGEGNSLDPNADQSFVVADSKGRTQGVAQDWAGIQEIMVANGGDFGLNARDDSPLVDGELPLVDGSPVMRPKPQGEIQVDLDQDASTSRDSLSDDMLGEGFNFYKEDPNTWSLDGVGPNGESYVVTRDDRGRFTVSERGGTGPDNFTDKDLQQFDNAREAFEYANDQSASPNEFDQDWVDELMSDQNNIDLDQDVPVDNRTKIDRSEISEAELEKYAPLIDDIDDAIFNNDRSKVRDLLSKAALDRSMSDETYNALYSGEDFLLNRNYMVENAIDRGDRGTVDDMINDPEYAGWRDRLQNAMDEFGAAPDDDDRFPNYDLDQDTPVLSEKLAEPATGKQYGLLKEYLDERSLDPATEQALNDALKNKGLNKAQASSLIGLARAADFKPGVDPEKPSERMLNSLQGYLTTKDLTPTEIKETLDSLEADGSRTNVDALLNKLRRKKDKPVDLNQGTGSLVNYGDGNYEWSDVYNSVSVNNGPNGWDVDYTDPDLEDRGGQNWRSRRFETEAEALTFAEELIGQNQKDDGFSRAADWLTSPMIDLDQEASRGTLEDAATDKQWGFLESLLNGKQIDNPELESAVRSALNDRNLTKGEVGAFIGQLRALEDKPNVRREPTAKQVASIRRAVLERDLSPEERQELEDRLNSGISFDEASEMLNDLKSRPITEQGMNNLLDNMLNNQDLDGLKYLLSKPEYSEYTDAIRDTIQTLRRDQGTDQDFDPELDLELGPDLDQGLGERPSPTEIRQDGNDIIDEIESLGPISDETREEFRDRIQGYREALRSFVATLRTENPDLIERDSIRLDRNTTSSDVDPLLDELEGLAIKARVGESSRGAPRAADYLDSISDADNWTDWDGFPEYTSPDGRLEIRLEGDPEQNILVANFDGESIDLDDETTKDIRDAIEENNFDSGTGRLTRSDTRRTALYISELLSNALGESQDGPDLDQDAGRSISRDDIVDSLADELDKGYENGDYYVNGEELQIYVDEFDSTTNPDTAGEMAAMVYDMSNSVRDPELEQRLRDLSARLDEELADRFGIGQAARYGDGRDSGIDLDNVVDKIRDEEAAFFETDTEKIADFLDDRGFYGDARSNGAEARVTENEDGTFTAEVGYDRDGEEQTFNDRDEAIAWAANKVSDYNFDVRPSSYVGADDLDLDKEASDAKTPEQGAAFADRLDEIADDIENNRGDERVANSLREYGERIRDLIAKRERDNQSQVPDEPTTPETMDEMAADPTLNPEGYAKSAADDIGSQISEQPDEGTYTSADGRVELTVQADVDGMQFFISVDKDPLSDEGIIFEGLNLNYGDVIQQINKVVADHFSKKA